MSKKLDAVSQSAPYTICSTIFSQFTSLAKRTVPQFEPHILLEFQHVLVFTDIRTFGTIVHVMAQLRVHYQTGHVFKSIYICMGEMLVCTCPEYINYLNWTHVQPAEAPSRVENVWIECWKHRLEIILTKTNTLNVWFGGNRFMLQQRSAHYLNVPIDVHFNKLPMHVYCHHGTALDWATTGTRSMAGATISVESARANWSTAKADYTNISGLLYTWYMALRCLAHPREPFILSRYSQSLFNCTVVLFGGGVTWVAAFDTILSGENIE